MVETRAGDTLDLVAHRALGGAQHVVALMELNRHVAGLPAVLPAGITLQLPDVPESEAAATVAPVRLWGDG